MVFIPNKKSPQTTVCKLSDQKMPDLSFLQPNPTFLIILPADLPEGNIPLLAYFMLLSISLIQQLIFEDQSALQDDHSFRQHMHFAGLLQRRWRSWQ